MKREAIFYIDEQGEITDKRAMRKQFTGLSAGRYKHILVDADIRTLKQNSYLHRIFTLCQPAIYNIGYRDIKTAEDAKQFIKSLFLTVTIVNEENNSKKEFVKPTSSLTKKEMTVFIDEIIQWAAEYLYIVLPSSKEYFANPDKYDRITTVLY